MAIVGASLLGGILAGLTGEALIYYTLFNSAIGYWQQRRQEKKNKPNDLHQKSVAPSTSIQIGIPVAVLFGRGVTGGNLFDASNPEDGGWPLYGGIGTFLPKETSYGIDLLDRSDNSIIPRDSDGKVSDLNDILKSFRVGNDASKKANNAIFRYFPTGGYSNTTAGGGGSYPSIQLKDGDGFNYCTVEPIATMGGYGAKYTNRLVVDTTNISPINPPIQVGDEIAIVDSAKGTLVSRTNIRAINTHGDRVWVQGGFNPVTRRNEPGYWGTTPNPDKISLLTGSTGSFVSADSFGLNNPDIDIFLYRYQGNKQPDSFLQQGFGNQQNNNRLAWLAVQVNNPGNTVDNVIRQVPSVVGLFEDKRMPMCESYTYNSAHPFALLASQNPFGIIFEIMTSSVFGLGLDPDKFIDIPSLIQCFNACASYDIEMDGPAWAFGGYKLDSNQKAADIIDDILDHVHGGYYERNNKIYFFMDGFNSEASAKTLSIDHVSRSKENGTDNRLKFKVNFNSVADRSNRIDVSFTDPEQEYVADYYFSINDLLDKKKKLGREVIQKYDVVGFHESKYAKKAAYILMNKEKYETRTFEIDTDMYGLTYEVGDILELPAFKSAEDPYTVESIRYTSYIEGTKYCVSYLPKSLRLGCEVIQWNGNKEIIDFGTLEDGRYYIETDGYLASPPNNYIGIRLYKGFKELSTTEYARIVKHIANKDLTCTITAQRYVPSVYNTSEEDYTIIDIQNIPTVLSDTINTSPSRPFIQSTNYQFVDSVSQTGSYQIYVGIGNTQQPNVKQTDVILYKIKAFNTEDTTPIQIAHRIVNSSDGLAIFDIPERYAPATGEKAEYFVTAQNIGEGAVNSGISDSRTDTGSTIIIEDSEIEYAKPAFTTDAFDSSNSFYNKTIKVTSFAYANPLGIQGIELRTDTNFSYNSNEADDPNFLGRYSNRIIYEQSEGLPNSRSITYYAKNFSSAGLYSDETSSITLTNNVPTPIPSTGFYQVSNFGLSASLFCLPYTGTPGNYQYENDIVEYKLFQKRIDGCPVPVGNMTITIGSDTYVEIDSAATPSFSINLPVNLLGADESYTTSFTILPLDRLSLPLADYSSSIGAVIDITFEKIQTADIALDALKAEVGQNLFRVEEWGYQGLRADNTEMVMSSGESYSQEIMLDKDFPHVFVAQVASGNDVTISSSGLGIDDFTLSVPSGSRFPLDLQHKMPQQLSNKKVTFTISSGASSSVVKYIRITQGDFATTYKPNIDDDFIPAKTKGVIDAVTEQNLRILDNLDILQKDVQNIGSSITKNDREINIRVKGDEIGSQLLINEQRMYFGSSDLVFDGYSTFINTQGVIWGKLFELGSGSAKVYVGPNVSFPSSGTLYQTFTGNQGTATTSFTYNNATLDANEGYWLLNITSGTPVYGLFIDDNTITTTTIDGGKITTNSLTADKIIANTIGASKLIAKDILTNLIRITGENNIVMDSESGIFIFSDGSISTEVQGDFYASSPKWELEVSEAIYDSIGVDDYIQITSSNTNHYNRIIKITDKVSYYVNPTGYVYFLQFQPLENIFLDSSNNPVTDIFFKSITKDSAAYIRINVDGGNPVIKMENATNTSEWTPNGISFSSGTIDIGSGSNSFHVDNQGNLWLGADTFAAAPVAISNDGIVNAIEIKTPQVEKYPLIYTYPIDIWNLDVGGTYPALSRTLPLNIHRVIDTNTDLRSLDITTSYSANNNYYVNNEVVIESLLGNQKFVEFGMGSTSEDQSISIFRSSETNLPTGWEVGSVTKVNDGTDAHYKLGVYQPGNPSAIFTKDYEGYLMTLTTTTYSTFPNTVYKYRISKTEYDGSNWLYIKSAGYGTKTNPSPPPNFLSVVTDGFQIKNLYKANLTDYWTSKFSDNQTDMANIIFGASFSIEDWSYLLNLIGTGTGISSSVQARLKLVMTTRSDNIAPANTYLSNNVSMAAEMLAKSNRYSD